MQSGDRVSFITTAGKLAEGVVILALGGNAHVRIESVNGCQCRRTITMAIKELVPMPAMVQNP